MGGTNLSIAQGSVLYQFLGGDSGGFDPPDTTPFYVVLGAGPLTSDPSPTAPAAAYVGTPVAIVPTTITRVDLFIAVAGTHGSAETGTMAIRVNNTTDTTVFNNTLQWNAASQSYVATGLSIALAIGDFFTCKFTPPIWATNPIATFYVLSIYGMTH